MRILKDWCFSCSFNRERLIGTYIVLLKAKGKIKVLYVLVQKETITYSFLLKHLPSWELKCPHPRHVWVHGFPFPKVGYVSFLEGRGWCHKSPVSVLQLSNATKTAKFHTLISIHRVFGPPAAARGLVYVFFGVFNSKMTGYEIMNRD